MLISKSITQSITQSINQTISGSSSASVPNMQEIIPSCNFDVDATVSASYGGSGQTFSNLVVAPADGVAVQTDYDFTLGANDTPSTDDPTFTGTAGDPAAFFAHDGGDFFQIAGGNPAWLDDLFKDMSGTSSGTTGWFSSVIHIGTLGFFRAGGTGDGIGFNGINFTNQTATNEIGADFRSGSSSTFRTDDDPITATGDYLITWTWDFSIASPIFQVYIGATSQTIFAQPPTRGTTTNGSDSPMQLMQSDDLLPAKSGAKTYAFSMGQDFLDQTAINAIKAEYELRHARSY